LEEIILMILLHYGIFFIYATIQQSHNHNGIASPLKLQMNDFKTNHRTKWITEKRTKYEPNYPKQSRIEHFPTRAAQREMAKHDRYIVHSILYSEMLSQQYLQANWQIPEIDKNKGPWRYQQKVCINIMVKIRKIPYINALIMTLMGSHELKEQNHALKKGIPFGHRLLSYTKLNLLNVERDQPFDEYDDVRIKIFQLPFLHKHHVREYHRFMKQDIYEVGRSHRLDKIQDFLASAHICMESDLPWCLMMEEFTVVTEAFLTSLKNFVIAPLESYAATHRVGMESDGQVFKRLKKMSVVSLFSAYDSQAGDVMRVHDVGYSSMMYEKDRAKLNSERKAMGLKEHSLQYELYPLPLLESNDANAQGGFDCAMLFHSSMVQNELIPMLQQLESAENARIVGGWFRSDQKDEVGVDSLDLEREFSLYTGIQRRRVEPSLVNRIGFYDQDFGGWQRGTSEKDRIGITNWLTDPRFLFEAGAFYEGREEFCELDNGNWIWDSFYESEQKSCCKEEFMKRQICEEEEEYRLRHNFWGPSNDEP